ncbi:hypothetical protein GCM10007160_32680 [Litchfieldella qijiaojingensis]|uniref:PQQ-binding-like beta-propeller repeat protein n=1 Tax=Litchfieldella qijiaojingensis TaxID=980347 RepID=A0ABQ2Z4H5_9GAMM|nr:arylsulfotransferase family protein [Halomonas qijiaojingensis]GGY02193.1 hypothetical protein GCM10007160_32680 [Halomonas qijiaojingensis]
MYNTERTGFALFFLAVVFLAFVGGAFVVLAKVFPYEYFNDAYKAAHALIEQRSVDSPYTQTDQWRKARTDARGVTIIEQDDVYEGLTLYTSGDGTYANLIDMEGNVVHRWSLPYSEVWQKSPQGRAPQPEELMFWRQARMLPNGDLIAIYIAANDSPWGYGIIKIDRDSRLMWSYHANTHHDFAITPDGRVIALTNEFIDEKANFFPALNTPWLDDFLVELDGESGKELSKTSLIQAFQDSPYRELLYAIPHFALSDPLHTNSVQFLDDATTQAFSPARGHPGQVLVTFRHPGAIGLVDLESGKMTWAQHGPWLGQHYGRALKNGNYTIFDNYANFEENNKSRILEVNPRNNAIVWRYSGDDDHPFDSGLRGAAETLPNGNRLVTESDGGRLFEVTRAGEIVWEFINPVRGGNEEQSIPVVSSGQRIALGDIDADFRDALVITRRRLP